MVGIGAGHHAVVRFCDASPQSPSLRGAEVRRLQYDNIPDAIFTFANNPAGAQAGIAQQVSQHKPHAMAQ